MEKNGDSKKLNFQTVLLVATLLFLVLEKVVLPSVNSGKLADEVKAQAVEIATLKECVIALRPLPVQVAEIRALLQSHMNADKEKR